MQLFLLKKCMKITMKLRQVELSKVHYASESNTQKQMHILIRVSQGVVGLLFCSFHSVSVRLGSSVHLTTRIQSH